VNSVITGIKSHSEGQFFCGELAWWDCGFKLFMDSKLPQLKKVKHYRHFIPGNKLERNMNQNNADTYESDRPPQRHS
jgi:hypothetical protein